MISTEARGIDANTISASITLGKPSGSSGKRGLWGKQLRCTCTESGCLVAFASSRPATHRVLRMTSDDGPFQLVIHTHTLS